MESFLYSKYRFKNVGHIIFLKVYYFVIVHTFNYCTKIYPLDGLQLTQKDLHEIKFTRTIYFMPNHFSHKMKLYYEMDSGGCIFLYCFNLLWLAVPHLPMQ